LGLADDRFALDFWPWNFLAQPAPLPEDVLAAAARSVVESAFEHWGTRPEALAEEVFSEYAAMLGRRENAHAICEEYRAAAGIDRQHDIDDLDAGRRIECDTLVMWNAAGPLGTWYAAHGGPLGVWAPWAPGAVGAPVTGGHFFPEENPADTARALADFLKPAGHLRQR
jgi:haloacetate dehalogenase